MKSGHRTHWMHRIFINNWAVIFLIIVGIIPLLDLLQPGLPLTHDGKDHVARIANFYQSLSEGILIPRWAGNLNWGFGHPILMFLYPFPSYLSSFFHFLGFSFIESLKIVFGLSFIISGFTMYLWIRNTVGEYAGVLAGILYMYAPYRFVDLYVRGAIGEHVAFIFIPLILYFIFKLSKNLSRKLFLFKDYLFIIGIAISIALFILSHNAMSIMFLPVIILYILYLSYRSKHRLVLLVNSVVGVLLGFLFSLFFWLPAFLEGKFTLRDIVTGNEYSSRFIEPMNLFFEQWNYGISGQFSIQLGPIHILGILVSFFAFYKFLKERDKQYIWVLTLLVVFLGSIFIMMKESDFIWRTITILQKFQFPWRFLSITTFTSAVLASYSLNLFNRNAQKILLIILILVMVFLSRNFWNAKDYLIKEDSFFEDVYYGTTDTGESAPIWSIRFMEKEAEKNIEVIDGKAEIVELSRTSTKHLYTIYSETETVRIRENTLYFPAWKVYVNGKEVPVQFQDPNSRGIITFNVSKGISDVVVSFEDTLLRKFSDGMTIASVLGILGYGIIIWLKRRKSVF